MILTGQTKGRSQEATEAIILHLSETFPGLVTVYKKTCPVSLPASKSSPVGANEPMLLQKTISINAVPHAPRSICLSHGLICTSARVNGDRKHGPQPSVAAFGHMIRHTSSGEALLSLACRYQIHQDHGPGTILSLSLAALYL